MIENLRLEEVEWPKPGKDFIYDTYNAYVAERPWMKEANVRPKSIAREMFEHWQSFEDYVKTYGLERIRLDPEARAAKHTRISEEEPRKWIVEQTLVDPEELNDWSLKISIDLDRCDVEGGVVAILDGLIPM